MKEKDQASLFVEQAVALDDKHEEKQKAKKKEIVPPAAPKPKPPLPLITKYRPDDFDLVIGNQFCVKSLAEAVRGGSCPHAFLLTGPSGIGKTTLARIIGKELNAFVVEINAALKSGIDDSRDLAEAANFRPISKNPTVLYIIDEFHNISQKGNEPLLKLLEDPPPHAYFALCTTEGTKIIETIKTRCYPVPLKALKQSDIEKLMELICELEEWTVDNDVFNGIVVAASGSARKALVLLQAGHAAKNREELSQLVAEVESEEDPAIALCVSLLKGKQTWKVISKLLANIDEPEAALTIACRYLSGAMIRAEEQQARDIWRMIEALSESRGTWDKKIQLYAGVGKILWS